MEQYLFQVESAILACLGIDNTQRNNAENWMYLQLEELTRNQYIHSLITLSRHSQNDSVRAFAAVYLRRKLPNGEIPLFEKLSEEVQNNTKAVILQNIFTENIRHIRHKNIDCISEIAYCTLYKGNWPELIPTILQYSTVNESIHRESCLLLWGKLADVCANAIEEHIPTLIFTNCFTSNQSSLEEIEAAFYSSCMIVRCVDQDIGIEKTKIFKPLLPLFLQVLHQLLYHNHYNVAEDCLKNLSDLANEFGDFFTSDISVYLTSLIDISYNVNFGENIQLIASEIAILIIESNSSILRKKKHNHLVVKLFHLAFWFLMQIHIDSNWDYTDDDDDIGETFFENGKDMIDRITASIGARICIPIVSNINQELLQHNDWESRNAALVCLTQVSEYLDNSQIYSTLDQFLNYCYDSNSRVRYAAIEGVGQLAHDFSMELQLLQTDRVINCFIQLLVDASPHVQSQTGYVILNYFDQINKIQDHVGPFLPNLINSCLERLQNGTRMVQESIITAIATIADSCPSYFYNDHFFRFKAIESLTLIGMSVPNKFINNIPDLMEILLLIHQQEYPHAPYLSYIYKAWTRISTVLKHNFVVYIDRVFPFILEFASIKVQFHENFAEESIETRKNILEASSSLLQDKTTGVTLLISIASETGIYFIPYLTPTVEFFLNHLQYHLSEEIRAFSFNAMSVMLNIAIQSFQAQKSNYDYINTLKNQIFDGLIEAVSHETDITVIFPILQSFDSCITLFPKEMQPCLSPQHIDSLFSFFRTTVINLVKRAQNRNENINILQNKDEYDQEIDMEMNNLLDQDEELISSSLEVIIKHHNTIVLPAFNKYLFDLLLQLLNSDSVARILSIHVFADIFKYVDYQSLGSSLEIVMPSLFSCSSSQDPSLLQPIFYCFGVLAQNFFHFFSPFVGQAVQILTSFLALYHLRKDNMYWSVFDNGMVALSRICEYQSQYINVDAVIPIWLSNLPLLEDAEETFESYDRFIKFVESNSPLVVKYLDRILIIISDILLPSHLADSTWPRELIIPRLEALLHQLAQLPITHSKILSLPQPYRDMLLKFFN